MQPISRRLFLACAAATARLLAQKDTTFSSDVNVVNVFATVRNKQGQIIRDLKKEDFSLDEEGRPQTIRYFSQESDLPLTLGLLIDTSGSQRRVLGEERAASYKFLKQVLREDKDQAFIIHFDHEVELLQDLTSSRKKLEAALVGLNESPPQQRGNPPGGGGPGGGRRGGRYPGRGGGGGRGGGTTLYDAVLLASDELMKNRKGRKALIVLSDGVDNGSKVSLGKGIEAAQRADTLAYSILFSDAQAYGGVRMGGRPGNSPSEFGKDVLQRLSRETGGGFFEVSKKLPIETVFEQIDEELRHQYSLGYTSDRTDAGPGFRIIHLLTKDPSLIVQSRSGYYAEGSHK
jgi:VWFA-related protein